MTTSPLILENVSKKFGGKTAVDNVSFEIGAGEIVGFLGPNGAGKTTSIRMALGLVPPSQGTVKLFGEAPSSKAFGRIGFLPCLLYTSPSPRDKRQSRMPSSA